MIDKRVPEDNSVKLVWMDGSSRHYLALQAKSPGDLLVPSVAPAYMDLLERLESLKQLPVDIDIAKEIFQHERATAP